MNNASSRSRSATDRALAERVRKGRTMNARVHKAVAVPPPSSSTVTRSAAYIEPEARDAMVAEAAYFRSAHRGFEPGHEIDDWLAAESEIDAALARGDLSLTGGPCP
jgi:hypothetical protein